MADSLTLSPLGPSEPTGPRSPFKPWNKKYIEMYLFSLWIMVWKNGLKSFTVQYVSMLTLSRQVSHAGVRFSCLSWLVNEKRADNVSQQSTTCTKILLRFTGSLNIAYTHPPPLLSVTVLRSSKDSDCHCFYTLKHRTCGWDWTMQARGKVKPLGDEMWKKKDIWVKEW